MFCPNCGAQNPEGVAFCGSCGTPLGAAQQQPVQQPAQQPVQQPQYQQPVQQPPYQQQYQQQPQMAQQQWQQYPQYQPQKKKFPLSKIILLVLVVVLIVVIFVKCGGSKKTKDPTNSGVTHSLLDLGAVRETGFDWDGDAALVHL